MRLDEMQVPAPHECTVSPFSNGSQARDWQAANCDRCTKRYDEGRDEYHCEIDWQVFTIATGRDGNVTEEMARRMGFEDVMPPHYCWQCPEVEWTEEWKSEVIERSGKPGQP